MTLVRADTAVPAARDVRGSAGSPDRLELLVGGVIGGSVAVGAASGWIPGLATIHGILILAASLAAGLFAVRRETVAVFAFAAAGSDVFWRMHEAAIPWEAGKYGAGIGLVLFMLRHRAESRATLPTIYFLLLIPSAALTLEALGWPEARGALSFNLSGPALLWLATMFFSDRPTQVHEAWRTLLSVASGAFLVLGTLIQSRIVGEPILYLGASSNFEASGGYGPNQVSSILGLGSVVIAMMAFSRGASVRRTILGLSIALVPLGFALGTLSRGGVISAGLALGAALLYLVFCSRPTRGVVTFSLCAWVLCALVLVPYMEESTQGTLGQRYAQVNTTNRDQLALDDLRAWKRRPLLGVGPGVLRWERGDAAHSEATRMLGEHGVLGAAALGILLVLAARGVRDSGPGLGRALSIALLMWTFTFSLHAAARIAAPAVVFGLAAAGFVSKRRSAD